MTGLMRHIEAVQNVTLPGDRMVFRVAGQNVGWAPANARHRLLDAPFGCREEDGAIDLPVAEDLSDLAASLAGAGAFKLRGEAFDVVAEAGGAPLTTVDRGALPWFGIRAEGVHVNGIVRRSGGVHLWIAHRAANRQMDPGKLDHVFAGGIAAGMDAWETLAKEGEEEAGFGREIVDQAVYTGSLRYVAARPEGLRRDRIHCFDLILPDDVSPVATDGEVAFFELWPVERVIRALQESDVFKFNVSLVLIDFLLRWELLPVSDETRHLARILRK